MSADASVSRSISTFPGLPRPSADAFRFADDNPSHEASTHLKVLSHDSQGEQYYM